MNADPAYWINGSLLLIESSTPAERSALPPLHFNHVITLLWISDPLDPIPPSCISLSLLWQIVIMVISAPIARQLVPEDDFSNVRRA